MIEITKIGYKQTEKHKQRISDSNKISQNKPSLKQKRRELMLGDKNPAKRPEVREKISESKKNISKETRKKLSDANKGQIPWSKGQTKETNESLDKMAKELSKVLTGRKLPESHKENIRKVTKEYYSNNPGVYNGEKNPNWKGGISSEPYCIKFNHEFKERVRNFFGRCCYVCGKNEIENGRKLDVHHVNYNKMVCCNDVKPLFVPLCRSCHMKTNKDREYWEEFFTISLEYLTKGECFIKKD